MDLSKVQLVRDYYLDNYNIYVNGYIYKDTKKPAYEAKKLTSYYYICSVCNEKKTFTKLSSFLHKKEEFKFCCQKCKKILTKSELNIHHLIPYRFCQENKEQNLISLCKSCHSKVERFLEKNCILDENNIDLKKELDFIYENEKDDIKNNREISYTR